MILVEPLNTMQPEQLMKGEVFMRKIFAFLLSVLLVCLSCAASAEGVDYTAMNDEELHALVDGARNELAKRELNAAEDTVIFEQEGVEVYLTGEHEVLGEAYLDLEAVVINDSDKSISLMVDSASINGWDVFCDGIYEVSSGKKKKGALEFNLEDAEISSYEEVEDIEISFYLVDNESYDNITEPSDSIALHFNAD